MMKKCCFSLLCACAALFSSSCSSVSQSAGPAATASSDVIVLDIGHFLAGEGAQSPFTINGKRIRECAFWYEYSYYVKQALERAGYRVVVCNRGDAPTSEPLLSFARRASVQQLHHPDRNAARYPSHYFPDRVGSGVVSADYAIYRKAACVVFLHLNSSGGATSGGSNSLVICNRYNGLPLAQSICQAYNTQILDHGMPNGGRKSQPVRRYVDADRSAAWMNACDDAGIPAAVTEVAYVNNREHAEFLSNDANARRFAECLANGIADYMRKRGSYPRHFRSNPNAADEGSFGYAAESRRLNVPGAKHLL